MNKKIGKDSYGFKYLFSISVNITYRYTIQLSITLDETANAKQAVLFMCGGINEIAEQIITMLRYCWKKHLKIVDLFLDMSGNAKQEKQCYDDLLAFIKYVDTKTAVVFYDNKIFHKYADTNDFLRFTATKKIELHLAKNRIILSNTH